MINHTETTCYADICDYNPDTDYDYFILNVLFFFWVIFM